MPSTSDSLNELAGQITRQADELIALMNKAMKDPEQAAQWADAARHIQAMWLEFQADQAFGPEKIKSLVGYQDKWADLAGKWWQALPIADPQVRHQFWQDGLALWQSVLAGGKDAPVSLPRKDHRFADNAWRDHPFFAVLHQTYLMACEQAIAMAEKAKTENDGESGRGEQMRFATNLLLDALSPSNFPLTNPQVIERAIETKGASLAKGMENFLSDLRRGQLTHTDPDAFRLGENIAATPGKVVHETPLFQLIQYSPTTDRVLDVPLVIFPPWINRFYILDLSPKKSFVRWAVDQGITVFMVSWKSADETMADIVWDDYIAAQIEAIDVARARLKVPAVHAIGYCVAGTTLAATLAVLARRGEADKVRSATFFTAQVDFTDSGDLRIFIGDPQIETIRALSPQGYFDGRYMSATFNLLRSNELLWAYVVNHYLLGQDYPAFDLLHWNGDVTNLPVKWHTDYLRDLYRDNRLVVPDSLSACGTPIDLARIETPCFIQAGREDHIAPPASVWKLTRHLRGAWTFILAGSGHIAGVVNPPAAGKYQYWTNEAPCDSLDEYISGATEHPGSWWPHWLSWLKSRDDRTVPAKGKRKPGCKGDRVIEDAPGRYVMTR